MWTRKPRSSNNQNAHSSTFFRHSNERLRISRLILGSLERAIGALNVDNIHDSILYLNC
jgi:hypothetical protein